MGSRLGAAKVAAKRIGITLEEYASRIEAGEKHCWKCQQWKLHQFFGTDRNRSDGLGAACTRCRRKPGSHGKRPLGDLPRQARNALNDAIRKGRMVSVHGLPCLDCGSSAEEYDHHRGYQRPNWLDVQAVCCKCHRKRDRLRRT